MYLLLRKLPWKKYAATRVVQHVANRAANTARRYKLLPKLKLFIAFFQARQLKSACPDLRSSHELACCAASACDNKPSPLSGGLRGARDLRRGAARGATLLTPHTLIPELHPLTPATPPYSPPHPGCTPLPGVRPVDVLAVLDQIRLVGMDHPRKLRWRLRQSCCHPGRFAPAADGTAAPGGPSHKVWPGRLDWGRQSQYNAQLVAGRAQQHAPGRPLLCLLRDRIRQPCNLCRMDLRSLRDRLRNAYRAELCAPPA